MKIFVDFDRVAFNTNRLYELLTEAGIEPGTKESLDYLFPEGGEPIEDLIFDDFKIFAEQQKELGNEIVFLSSATGFSAKWDMEYHFEKMKRSGIAAFGKLVPVDDEKTAVIEKMLKKEEKAVFIDDSLSHLRHARDLGMNVCCIQMVRSNEMRTSRGLETVETSAEFPQAKIFKDALELMNGIEEVKAAA